MALRWCLTVGRHPRRGGAAVMGMGLMILAMIGIAQAADGPVYYSGGKPIPLEAVNDHVTILLVPDASFSKVALDLAHRGMPTLINPAGARGGNSLRVVPVNSADVATMNQVRSVAGIGQVRRLYRDSATKQQMIATDMIVVRVKPGMGAGDIDAFFSAYGVKMVRSLESLGETYLVQLVDSSADAVQVAAAMYQDGRAVYCHPDFVAQIAGCAVEITDPLYPQQWHLNNTGQSGATVDADVDWQEAWEAVVGYPGLESILIAIHDDSVQITHEDLKDAYISGYDFTGNDDDPSPAATDDNHGTAVAGIALARLNGIGVVGAAPRAGLVAIRWGMTDSKIAEGFAFAMTRGCDVINNSWGPSYPGLPVPDVIKNAIDSVIANGRRGRGMVVVFSGGNYGLPITSNNPYAVITGVVGVGASDSRDRITAYSAYGPGMTVVAPGGDPPTTLGIVTTDVMDDPNLGLPTKGYNDRSDANIITTDFADGSYTRFFAGTSASAPLVSGIAGLILGTNASLTSEQVMRIFEHTADQIDTTHTTYDPVTGQSSVYSFGRANAYKAVVAAKAATNGLTWPAPVESLEIAGTSSTRMTWKNPTGRTNEAAKVMVVHSVNKAISWSPEGMRTETPKDYEVGQFVSPGVQVVKLTSVTQASADSESFNQSPGQGAHFYAVFIQNAAKRWSWGQAAGIVLGPNNAPKASLTASPRSGEAPLMVEFVGGALDLDSEDTTFTYSWDFGDGSPAGPGSQSAIHTYQQAGNYLATLTVKDQSNLVGTATVIIRVSPPATTPPAATIALSPGDGQVPLIVKLQGGPTVGIRQWVWDFGDGTRAAAKDVEHTYVNPGVYAITLEVLDQSGQTGRTTKVLSVWQATMPEPMPTTSTTNSIFPFLPNCGAIGGTASVAMLATMVGWYALHFGRRRRG